MREAGQLIVAVEPSAEITILIYSQLRQTTENAGGWRLQVFDEELKGSGSVMSTFMADIEKMFKSAINAEGIEGIIINPWNRHNYA